MRRRRRGPPAPTSARPRSSRPTGPRSACSPLFVVGTLFITKWAAAKTKSAADFYTAGGGITGFQNGLAIAGDYMSAASFLGISAAVMAGGYDGLIYSIGFLVGWPVLTFLMAERLRNLGKFTFADVAAFRFEQTPVRVFAASGTLVVVAFYLIAQMVGAGPADQAAVRPRVLDRGRHRRRADDGLRAVRRHDRDHLGADHQGLPAAGRRDASWRFMVLWHFGFSPEALFAKAVEVKTGIAAAAGKPPTRRRPGLVDHGPGRLHQGPDLGDLASAWR